jgi:4-alpha-glucanotransferase
MNQIAERAAQWGIEIQHHDGLGRHWTVDAGVLERILHAAGADRRAAPSEPGRPPVPGLRAYQGRDSLPDRSWALAIQLYGIRSRRNWGHGDFTDLAELIDIVAALGATGIGLNPLHALFDDRAGDASPYYPNSRYFLNQLYIDVDAVPEFPAVVRAPFEVAIADMRTRGLVDYTGIARLKTGALAIAYDHFLSHGTDTRRQQFDDFRKRRGFQLASFAAFELLRKRFQKPWWEWPQEWRKPDPDAIAELQATHARALGAVEFVQWIADEQVSGCRDRARRVGLPMGLYLDLAVGVRPDGFDAWSDQDFTLPGIEIGAPPDALNTHGQCWGLAAFNPVRLLDADCAPFRQVLRASMQYAGAIRLDHVLGLKRLYLVPNGVRADHGAYIRFPFERMLAIAAEESVANRCIVIGEDLGTVPPGFRETLAAWGVWSYHVMMFQRAADGGFVAPDHYRRDALVTFATHDLPTFAGWLSKRDLAVKRELGIDPGETDQDRSNAIDALQRAMAWQGLPSVDYPAVARFLAQTPSRILVVGIEDVLGLTEQTNLPGTINEHPNWSRRLPVDLADCASALAGVASIMTEAGRRAGSLPTP